MPVPMSCMCSYVWRPKGSLRCLSPEAEEHCLESLVLVWNLPTDPVVPRDLPVSAFPGPRLQVCVASSGFLTWDLGLELSASLYQQSASKPESLFF